MNSKLDEYRGLFDVLLAVLDQHKSERGAEKAYAYLKSAKLNYVHNDTDRMIGTAMLALQQILEEAPYELQAELREKVLSFIRLNSASPEILRKLAQEYEASGGKLLSPDEVLQEVAERRGAAR